MTRASPDRTIEERIAARLQRERERRAHDYAVRTGSNRTGPGASNPWSQGRIARRLGLSAVGLYYREQGRTFPQSLREWCRWAALYDIDFADLLAETR